MRAIIAKWIKSLQNEKLSSAYDRVVASDTLLTSAINFAALKPSVRHYLFDHGILYVTDVAKMNFEDMLRSKNIGKKSVRNLINELVQKGILQESEYLENMLLDR